MGNPGSQYMYVSVQCRWDILDGKQWLFSEKYDDIRKNMHEDVSGQYSVNCYDELPKRRK